MRPVDTRTITRTGQRRGARGDETPYLFGLLRCDAPLEGTVRFHIGHADMVVLGRGDRPKLTREAASLRIEIADGRMSGTHARLQRVLGEWIVEDAGSKNGTFLDGRRVDHALLRDGALLELGHSFLLFRAALPAALPETVGGAELESQVPALRTLSPALKADLERLTLVAQSKVAILLSGETGTGKEIAARAIHDLSGRSGPFVAVNCGALPATLVESELFGFRKGAFSGAAEDRLGLVRSADGGSLFLDEIGDLPLAAQAALLRVLQEGEVHPLGATKPVAIDLRVVAATHRDLEALSREEKFRPDLLARLSGFALRLPALRERREDFGVLMSTLLRKLAGHAANVSFTVDAARALLAHQWPLNIRELEKCLAAALALAPDGHIDLEHLPPSLRSPPEQKGGPGAEESPEHLSDDDRRRREELITALRACDGNITAAAKSMGKPRTQVQRWLRRWKIDPLAHRR
jgi:transcriptional regulator with GAF, ATPase, and Fis domain